MLKPRKKPAWTQADLVAAAKAPPTVGHNSEERLAYEYKNLRYEPLMLRALMLMQASGLNDSAIQRKCGVTSATLRNWRQKKTRRPNGSTLRVVAKALGYKLDFSKE